MTMNMDRKKIERVTITGPLEEYKAAHEFCATNGFRIIQNNPCLSGGDRHNKIAMFELVAERVMET